MDYREATFTIDGIEGEEFKGWTAGDKWNGWAVPVFMFSEAQRILDALTDRGDGSYSWFDRAEDAFCYFSPDEMEEAKKFPGIIINTDGQDRKVYPIGTYTWTWEEKVTA